MIIKRHRFHLILLTLLMISFLSFSDDSTNTNVLTDNDSISNEVEEPNIETSIEAVDSSQKSVEPTVETSNINESSNEVDQLKDTSVISNIKTSVDTTTLNKESKDASDRFDSKIEPAENSVVVKNKQLRNPHSKGTGFIIPGIVLPAVSGVLWGGSYLLEIQAGKNWISQKERVMLNSLQITGTVLGSAGVTLLTIGIVKRAKRDKWDKENKLVVIPAVDIENSSAGIYMSLKF